MGKTDSKPLLCTSVPPPQVLPVTHSRCQDMCPAEYAPCAMLGRDIRGAHGENAHSDCGRGSHKAPSSACVDTKLRIFSPGIRPWAVPQPASHGGKAVILCIMVVTKQVSRKEFLLPHSSWLSPMTVKNSRHRNHLASVARKQRGGYLCSVCCFLLIQSRTPAHI